MLAVVLSAFDLGAADPRPNILFIMSDDHAAQSMSCYGSRLNQTPQMDRLASQGMRFTHCFAINSICTPSRAAILTGKYHHRNGVPVFNRFDGRQDNVAKRLKAAGYQTGMIGKWHLFSDPTGFDYWNILPGQGDYHNPVMIENGRTNKYTGYVTDLITDFSIDFLKKRDPDRPFLLMTHHKATHRNWQPDSRHAAMYENVKIPEPATIDDDYAGRSPAAAEATMRLDRNLSTNDLKGPIDARLTPSEKRHSNYQRYLKDYLRCLASMDDNVGRLLDYLDQSGLATNTLVIYTSDQGFFLGEHGWYDKRFMYEESLRMPLLARLAGSHRAVLG
jgi:arylsulfatase A-like enzyme